jgi:ribosome-associated heat shock protein Hsp15
MGHEDSGGQEEAKVRLDKWLWAARFFKTRQLAAEAVTGGKVHLNGQRAKAGKEIAVGAHLQISKDQLTWDLTVVHLGQQRRPAKETALWYEETAESVKTRQEAVAKAREDRELGVQPDHRPNKKERRAIHRFKREEL